MLESTLVLIVKAVVIFASSCQSCRSSCCSSASCMGRMQSRYGPNRVGPCGLLQPLADVLKLLSKEQSTPATAVPWMMAIAPVISVITAVATLAIVPFGARGAWGGDFGLYGIDVPIGILYFFAFGSLAFYGFVLGGWASGSKYSFLGAMRAAAQLISYEVALGLSLLGVVMTAGSLSLVDIVEPRTTSGTSSRSSSASDLPGGRLRRDRARRRSTSRRPTPRSSAGYNTEYGGMRFGSFFMAEYMQIIVISGIAAACSSAAGTARARWRSRRCGCCSRCSLGVVLLHLGARHAAAPALRPADVVRLEGPAAAGDAQRARDRDLVVADLMATGPGKTPSIAVQRGPEPGGLGGAYRAFGATLRGLRRRSGAWSRAGHDRVPGGEDAGLPALPRPPQAAPLRGHRAREVRRLLAVRGRLPGRVHPRGRGREHARATRSRPASATRRSTRST